MVDRAKLIRQASGVAGNPYIPYFPFPRQALFLGLPDREALYGGAAGGAKTFCLLMAALQYVDVPGYHAVLFRRTYPELDDPDGLIPLSKEWLGPTDAKYHGGRRQWTFPSGAVLAFKHLQDDKAAERAGRGPSYQFMGFDELTTFTEYQYRTPQSRLRRPRTGDLSKVPLRVRSGTNPGGEGHEWVKQRFLEEKRPFVPSLLTDNKEIDQAAYVESLEAALDPVTLARMLRGDWDIAEPGEVFDRAAAEVVQVAPRGGRLVRFWDTAGSVGKDAAFTAGLLMMDTGGGRWLVLDVQRFKERPDARDARILQTAQADREKHGSVRIVIEKGAADAGIKQADDHMRLLAGFDVSIAPPSGDKVTRAGPVARQYNAGSVRLLSGPWIGPFLDEIGGFPSGKYKDQVDALSGAFNELNAAGVPGAAVGGTRKKVVKARW